MSQTMMKQLLRFAFFIVATFLFSNQLLAFDYHQDTASVFRLCKSARKNTIKNYPLAVLQIDSASEITNRIGDRKLLFKVHRVAGLISEDNNKFANARDNYNKALFCIEDVTDSQKLDIYIDLAIVNRKLSNYKISRDFYDKTLILAQKLNDTKMVEYAYNGFSTLHKTVGEYDKAIEYELKSMDLSEKRNGNNDVIISLINISDIYLKAKNLDLALSHIQKAYNLVLSSKDSTKLGQVNNLYGKILNAQGNYQQALSHHLEALNFFEKKQDKSYILQTYIFLADVYLQMQNYVEAEKYFVQCYQYTDYFEHTEEPNFYYKLGYLYQEKNQIPKAIAAYKKSLELAEARGFKDNIQKANLSLAQVCQLTGDFKGAYNYLQVANSYRDSLFNEEKSKRLSEAQFKFDVEKSEKDMQAQSDKTIQTLKLQQSRYWLFAAVLVFSIGFIAMFYFLQLKSKTNIMLLQKNGEINLQNNRLEKSNEILRQFAYASAHDLKEPLRSISSFVSIIDRKYNKLLPPEAGEYMNFVTSGVKRMENLLSALLEYSTVASEEEQEILKSTSVSLVLRDVIDNLHSTIADKNAQVNSFGTLPSVLISRLHLTQLFQNIISNALKFSDKTPVIEVKGVIKDDKFLITIKDNGIGMKLEYSDKIFRLFQRLSRSAQYEGTGIGLAICKHIVDKYNGTIWFESVEGVGTTFFLSFPAKIVKNEANTEGVNEAEKPLSLTKII